MQNNGKSVIIGLTGKAGSGKSFISEQITEKTGFRLVKLDYQAGQVANKFLLKQALQRKIKRKIPKAHEDIQLFPLLKDLDTPFRNWETSLFLMFLNRKLKKIIREARKNGESLIVDFISLPFLKCIELFDRVYLVETDNDKRLERLGARDGMTKEWAEQQEKFIEKFYSKHDTFDFCGVIYNDYEELPKEVEELIEEFKENGRY